MAFSQAANTRGVILQSFQKEARGVSCEEEEVEEEAMDAEEVAREGRFEWAVL